MWACCPRLGPLILVNYLPPLLLGHLLSLAPERGGPPPLHSIPRCCVLYQALDLCNARIPKIKKLEILRVFSPARGMDGYRPSSQGY